MKIILVTAQKGGVGKSTLTFLFAKLLGEDFKIGVVDIDNQGTFLTNKSFIEENNPFTIFSWSQIENNPESTEGLDFLIIDSPPYNMSMLSELVQIADYILIPIKMEDISITSVVTTLERLESLNAKKKSLIVPSMVIHNRNYLESYEVLDSLGFEMLDSPLIQYSILSKIFLNKIELDGNALINTEKCISGILKFINN